MSGDGGLRFRDKVINIRTHESGTVVSSDGLTVVVTGPGFDAAIWAVADVERTEGSPANTRGQS